MITLLPHLLRLLPFLCGGPREFALESFGRPCKNYATMRVRPPSRLIDPREVGVFQGPGGRTARGPRGMSLA
jgi:hypothetical protein